MLKDGKHCYDNYLYYVQVVHPKDGMVSLDMSEQKRKMTIRTNRACTWLVKPKVFA